MGNMGHWGNLKDNLERTRTRIAEHKLRNKKKLSKLKPGKKTSTSTRKILLLTETRKKSLNKIRLFLILLLVIIAAILSQLL